MATLKMSDLSVGDWVGVRCGTKINAFKVEEIRFNNIIHKYVALLNNKAYGLPTTELHPIPITAEILEKNGFVRCSVEFNIYEYTTLLGKILRTTQVHLLTSQSISVFLHDTTIERGFPHREKTSVSILRDKLYVHDIQHALRLAGIDKELNL